jgi:hypothetical protein
MDSAGGSGNNNNNNNIAIRKFDPSKMRPNCIVLMVAKRGSGKSLLVKDLMYHKRHMVAGLAMSATEPGNGFYSSWIPPLFVYNEFDKNALGRLIQVQRRLTRENKAREVFVILDDCGYDKRTLNDKVMRELLYNGRHYKITVFLCVQYIHDITPGLRSNIDYIFALRENVHRDKLFKNFFPMVGNLATFNAIADACTSDFGALVLDNTSTSCKLNDIIFWYKANIDRKPFRIGSPEFWRYSKDHYDKESAENDGDEGGTLSDKTKRVVEIRVRKVGTR